MSIRAAWSSFLPLMLALPASAQCLEWDASFDFQGGVSGPLLYAQAIFDDGSGPALYVGGRFQTAGSVPAANLARWNGSSWSAVGGGTGGSDPTVRALEVFDDGTGPALYAAGSFASAGGVPANHVARWNGTSWSPLGGGITGTASVLRVFDDGSGPRLYAGGMFSSAGVPGTVGIACWDGSAWTSVGGGLNSGSYCLEVLDDGFGPALYAGGEFTSAGGLPASKVARWNGTNWSALGPGLNLWVSALGVFDDGAGPAIYAGGTFMSSGGSPVSRFAKWDGVSWAEVGGGLKSAAYCMRVFDDGSGPRLYVGGGFTSTGTLAARFIARWDGTAWSTVGSGANHMVFDLLEHDDGNGPGLFAAGTFSEAGGVGTPGIAKWRSTGWEPVRNLSGKHGMSDPVLALAVHDDGGGPALYAGGNFMAADGLAAGRVARWTGSGWSALASGFSGGLWNGVVFASALLSHDDGTGPALYAAGEFTHAGATGTSCIARWDGAGWSPLGAGVTSEASALCTFQGQLYAGGTFGGAGACASNGIARWDGAGWTCLPPGMNGPVKALAVFDDGSGPALFVGGQFTTAGGLPASYMARFDGTSWSAVGGGTDNHVFALAVFDDGSGPALYAGGGFTLAGGVPASGVARWNGSSWTAVAGGIPGVVRTLAVFDDGSGAALCAGGDFSLAGGAPADRLARLRGSTWTAFGGGLDGPVLALCAFDDGTGGGADLFVGGGFLSAGSTPSARIARWFGCSEPGTRLCFGDAFSTACPCGNQGVLEHGCENSAATGGGMLYASGTNVPDTVVLHASNELPNALSIFLQGNAVVASVPFGDGLRCAGGDLKRLYTKHASGGLVRAPEAGDPSITSQSANLGDTIPPGERRYYQVYYRDPSGTHCPAPAGSTFNVTSAVKISW